MNSVISNEIVVKNPTPELIWWCQDNLTLKNPDYETLMRIGKEQQARRFPEYIRLYADVLDTIRIPFGCLNSVWPIISKDSWECSFNAGPQLSCVNDKITQPLYDYQEEAVQKMVAAKGGVLVGGCGAGKTNAGVEILHRIGKRTLWICGKKDLLKQTVVRMKSLYPNMKVGTITEGQVNIDEVTVSTVQTLAKVDPSYYASVFDTVIVDECFPENTEVETVKGKKRIKDLHNGDLVLSYNHKKGKFEYKPVIHKFVKKPQTMVAITLENGKKIYCTENHPIFTNEGYIQAKDIYGKKVILQSVWEGTKQGELPHDNLAKNVEKWDRSMQGRMSKENFFYNNVSNQQKIRFSKNESKQSIKKIGSKRKNFQNYEGKRLQANFEGWEWDDKSNSIQTLQCPCEPKYRSGVGVCCSNQEKEGNWLSNKLQNRHSNASKEDCHRSEWPISLSIESSTSRRKEKRIFNWVRVESVDYIQPTSDGTFNGLCGDSNVYNIEVKDNNNYIADDVLVHNCHHCVSEPSKMKMFGKVVNKIAARYKYGLTATPKRNDSLTNSMYALLGCSKEKGFAPVWEIARQDTKTLTAEHRRVDLDTPFSYAMLNDDGTFNYNGLVDYIASYEPRNKYIVGNVSELVKTGRKQLVLCSRVEQCELLNNMLVAAGVKSVILVGKVSGKKRTEILNNPNGWDVIVATTSLAKEGLDVPILDTLHLVSCIANKTDTVQSVGRIERICEGKQEPIAYDYVDTEIPYLVSRYKKRAGWLKRRF